MKKLKSATSASDDSASDNKDGTTGNAAGLHHKEKLRQLKVAGQVKQANIFNQR